MKNKLKKVIIFIVEGSTDEDSLRRLFQKIYQGKSFRFMFTSGDITADENTTVDNVESMIKKLIEEVKDYYRYRNEDIWQIVQLMDMDGAYIDDEHAFEEKERERFFYREDGIVYKDREKIIERNAHKREIMDYLVDKVTDIMGISYTTFFMSTDLEHALHNIRNCPGDKKQALADEFYEKYKDKPMDFMEFLRSLECPEKEKAWKFIRERNLNSLSRASNLVEYFDHNPIGYD